MVALPATCRMLHRAVRELLDSSFEADQLFAHVTGWQVYDLPTVGDQQVPEEQSSHLLRLCRRRRAGEPLQYLLGEWEFYGLPFSVGEGVLIPRADTELLVDRALEILRLGGEAAPQVVDLCSGSGAVAIAVAHHTPQAVVTAVELDPTAFSWLERNISRNGSGVRGVLADACRFSPEMPVDLITANPPYIPGSELETLQEEVRHEPRMALDGGADGLDFYRALARHWRNRLKPGGSLCFEVGAGQSDPVSGILEENGYREIRAYPDLNRIPRVVCCTRPTAGERSIP